jgi:hypothetical protein
MKIQRQIRSRHLANALYMSCNSGASLDNAFQSPTRGFMVGGAGKIQNKETGERALIFPSISEVIIPKVETWIEENKLKRFQYYGVWCDNGKVYFDVSDNVFTKEAAIKIGKSRNQLSIWSLNSNKQIDL